MVKMLVGAIMMVNSNDWWRLHSGNRETSATTSGETIEGAGSCRSSLSIDQLLHPRISMNLQWQRPNFSMAVPYQGFSWWPEPSLGIAITKMDDEYSKPLGHTSPKPANPTPKACKLNSYASCCAQDGLPSCCTIATLFADNPYLHCGFIARYIRWHPPDFGQFIPHSLYTRSVHTPTNTPVNYTS